MLSKRFQDKRTHRDTLATFKGAITYSRTTMLTLHYSTLLTTESYNGGYTTTKIAHGLFDKQEFLSPLTVPSFIRTTA